ncbi:MAG: hypothetical protein FE047_00375 [Thermoplasmata archaeon]|nr:MAG: hypothetical protein FE047_00375 [Thermoplasmata archaeon]
MIAELFVAVIGIGVAIRVLPSIILLSQFSYPNAKFSAIEPVFLREKEIARLLESKNLEELKNNVISKDFILEGEEARELQKSIEESHKKIILMAIEDSPKKVQSFYEMWIKKMDAEKLKEAIRNIIEDREIEVEPTSIEMKELIERLRKVEQAEVERVLKEYGYLISLEMPIEEIEKEIDKKIIEDFKQLTLPKSCKKAIEKFVGTWIDILNIKTILRGKHYGMEAIDIIEGGWEVSKWKIEELLKVDYIPEIISLLEGTSYYPALRDAITDFEKEGVIALERALDKYLLQAVGMIANEYPLSIGPGIRFMVEKEAEARNLKAVAKAVAEEMPEEAWKVVVVI